MSDVSKAVFLSYASQDAEAARHICDALRGAGVEVWFDVDGGLEHGDEWDAKIRRQIKECVLFIPIISATTQAREEGYFRLEWELAAERAMSIASGVAFILPIVIDATREPDALVPDRFRKVQWTRLPGGVVTPEVRARLLKLWSHRTGLLAAGAVAAGGTARPVPADPAGGRSGAPRRWPVLAAGAAGLAILIAAGAWWRFGGAEKGPVPVPAVAAPDLKKAVPPPSEAQQLITRARGMCEKIGFTRDELALADDLCRRATELEPTSAAAWAARAFVNANFMNRGWDKSEKRAREVQSSANRALAFNAEEPEALMALGMMLATKGAAPSEVEPLLRRAIAAAPGDSRPVRQLGYYSSHWDRTNDSRALLEEATRINPRDALAYYNLATHHAARGQLAEAWQSTESALALAPGFGSALLLQASLAVRWKGDLVAMRTALDRLPAAERGDDRAVYFSMWGGILERDPRRVLAAGALGTNEYLVDNLFAGPKAWLTALAYEAVKQQNLARREWEAAEALLRKRLRENPAGGSIDHAFLGYTLAWLGRAEEAAREIAPFASQYREEPSTRRAGLLATYHAALGDAAGAAPYLRYALENGANGGYGGFTVHLLRLDPMWDRLRGQPEFEALLKEPKVSATR
jgi:tetratricopeptide (TPR) repeat protein